MSPLRLVRLAAAGLVALVAMLALATPASAQYNQGTTITISLSATVVVQGQNLTITASGAATITVRVFSTPIDLGTQNTGPDGAATYSLNTSSLELGQHRVVATAPDGRSAEAYFEVIAPGQAGVTPIGSSGSAAASGSGGGLASTGTGAAVPLAVGGVALVVAGAAGIAWGRRRAGGSAA